MRSFEVQAINDEIMKKLSLKKRYSFLNTNLMAILDDKQKSLMNKIQRFCIKYDKKVDHLKDDIYDWIPDFGAEGYITRSRQFKELDLGYDYYGLSADLIRAIAVDAFDPQFNLGAGAGVLAINPLAEHHDNQPHRLEALREMLTGKAVGCICITEPEVGSDAVRMLTTAERTEDGAKINGEKIFTTNGPKSKYAVVYATTEARNPKTMMQFYMELPKEGVKVERVGIPWVPKLFLGKETFTDAFVPNDHILGDVGAGRKHLFEGLVRERIGIGILGCSEMWNAITHAAIYCNMREQMGKVILKHQGVGFLLTDLWSKTVNYTLALLKFCELFDSATEKYNDEIPPALNGAMVASASQLKYEGAILSEKVCYEAANLMGGAGVCDNTLMHDLLGVSRIQEVIGGSRQIQQYVMSMALRQLYKMAI